MWCSGESQFALEKYFKYASFRPGQLDAVLPELHKKDVLVRMATGSGKSLCMYLVPLASGSSAVGIIISPLIGLIGQQVRISMKIYQFIYQPLWLFRSINFMLPVLLLCMQLPLTNIPLFWIGATVVNRIQRMIQFNVRNSVIGIFMNLI